MRELTAPRFQFYISEMETIFLVVVSFYFEIHFAVKMAKDTFDRWLLSLS